MDDIQWLASLGDLGDYKTVTKGLGTTPEDPPILYYGHNDNTLPELDASTDLEKPAPPGYFKRAINGYSTNLLSGKPRLGSGSASNISYAVNLTESHLYAYFIIQLSGGPCITESDMVGRFGKYTLSAPVPDGGGPLDQWFFDSKSHAGWETELSILPSDTYGQRCLGAISVSQDRQHIGTDPRWSGR